MADVSVPRHVPCPRCGHDRNSTVEHCVRCGWRAKVIWTARSGGRTGADQTIGHAVLGLVLGGFGLVILTMAQGGLGVQIGLSLPFFAGTWFLGIAPLLRHRKQPQPLTVTGTSEDGRGRMEARFDGSELVKAQGGLIRPTPLAGLDWARSLRSFDLLGIDAPLVDGLPRRWWARLLDDAGAKAGGPSAATVDAALLVTLGVLSVAARGRGSLRVGRDHRWTRRGEEPEQAAAKDLYVEYAPDKGPRPTDPWIERTLLRIAQEAGAPSRVDTLVGELVRQARAAGSPAEAWLPHTVAADRDELLLGEAATLVDDSARPLEGDEPDDGTPPPGDDPARPTAAFEPDPTLDKLAAAHAEAAVEAIDVVTRGGAAAEPAIVDAELVDPPERAPEEGPAAYEVMERFVDWLRDHPAEATVLVSAVLVGFDAVKRVPAIVPTDRRGVDELDDEAAADPAA